jgi:hypothetical protein
MRTFGLRQALAVFGMAGGLFAAPSLASDQALQAILQKLRCLPSKIAAAELAAGVVSYEVTCKGRPDFVFIVCQGADCRQQTKRLNHESEPPS